MGEYDNDRININITNNVNNSNSNENNNDNNNDNENNNDNTNKNTFFNFSYGEYRFFAWAFGLTIFFFVSIFIFALFKRWLNESRLHDYTNYKGKYNLVSEFNKKEDIIYRVGDWVLTDVVEIQNEIFGLYIPELAVEDEDTLIIGSAARIYTFLDNSFYCPKRIQKFNREYILIASKTDYRTLAEYKIRYNPYDERYLSLKRKGYQYKMSLYDSGIGIIRFLFC